MPYLIHRGTFGIILLILILSGVTFGLPGIIAVTALMAAFINPLFGVAIALIFFTTQI